MSASLAAAPPAATGISRASLQRSLFALASQSSRACVTRPILPEGTVLCWPAAIAAESEPVITTKAKKGKVSATKRGKKRSLAPVDDVLVSPTAISEFEILDCIPLLTSDTDATTATQQPPRPCPFTVAALTHTRSWNEVSSSLGQNDRKRVEDFATYIKARDAAAAESAAAAAAASTAAAIATSADVDVDMTTTVESLVPCAGIDSVADSLSMPPPDLDAARAKRIRRQLHNEKMERLVNEKARANYLEREKARSRKPLTLTTAEVSAATAEALASASASASVSAPPLNLLARAPLATLHGGQRVGIGMGLGLSGPALCAGLPPKHREVIGGPAVIKRARFAPPTLVPQYAATEASTPPRTPRKTKRIAWIEANPNGLRPVRRADLARSLREKMPELSTPMDEDQATWQEHKPSLPPTAADDEDCYLRGGVCTPLPPHHALASQACDSEAEERASFDATLEHEVDWLENQHASVTHRRAAAATGTNLRRSRSNSAVSRSTSLERAGVVGTTTAIVESQARARSPASSNASPAPRTPVAAGPGNRGSQQVHAALTPLSRLTPTNFTPRTPAGPGAACNKQLAFALPPSHVAQQTPRTHSTFGSSGRSSSMGVGALQVQAQASQQAQAQAQAHTLGGHVSKRSAIMRKAVQQIHIRAGGGVPTGVPHANAPQASSSSVRTPVLVARSPSLGALGLGLGGASSVGESPLQLHQSVRDDAGWLERRVIEALEQRLPRSHPQFGKAQRLVLNVMMNHRIQREGDDGTGLSRGELKHLCTEKLEESVQVGLSQLKGLDASAFLPQAEERPASVQVRLAGLALALPHNTESRAGADSPASVMARVTPLHFPTTSALTSGGVHTPPVHAATKGALNNFTTAAMAGATTPQLLGAVAQKQTNRWVTPLAKQPVPSATNLIRASSVRSPASSSRLNWNNLPTTPIQLASPHLPTTPLLPARAQSPVAQVTPLPYLSPSIYMSTTPLVGAVSLKRTFGQLSSSLADSPLNVLLPQQKTSFQFTTSSASATVTLEPTLNVAVKIGRASSGDSAIYPSSDKENSVNRQLAPAEAVSVSPPLVARKKQRLSRSSSKASSCDEQQSTTTDGDSRGVTRSRTARATAAARCLLGR